MTDRARSNALPVDLYSTCPPSVSFDGGYRERVAEVARWSEEAGCRGILVYADNRLVDPWLVAQIVAESTRRLAPLVAVQPAYMHPYAVAKMVTSLGHLYGRRVDLNMVSGGFRNDLLALADETPHDRRYERLVEYTTIVQRLLAGGAPVALEGEFYRVRGLKLSPPLPPDLAPTVFVSGSSEAGRAAARALGAVAVKYPAPAAEEKPEEIAGGGGIRVGIVARASEEEAWEVARARFPGDRKGRLTHELAMRVSDSVWHRELSERAGRADGSPYWLFPFENYRTMCPYLVGSYERVGAELARYLERGFGTLVLDVPPDAAELAHTREALAAAASLPRAAAS
jgi:alkanesulfonate monooxygenase